VPFNPKAATAEWRIVAGFKAATTDRTTITTWWKQWPGAMIGIPTGEPSGVFVLDIDRDEGKGLDGFAGLAAMEAAHGPLPATRTSGRRAVANTACFPGRVSRSRTAPRSWAPASISAAMAATSSSRQA
jgi:hypothetical protein